MQYTWITRAALGTLIAAGSAAALADEALSPWQVRAGISNVVPTSSPGSIVGGAVEVDIENQYTPTVTLSYFLTPHLALDAFGGFPPKHVIKGNGAKIGSARHAPPIVSLQYHFAPEATIRPYIGVGVNYTRFSSEKSPLGKLELSDSWGLAGQVGVDYAVDKRWTVGADVRYAEIDTDVTLNGAKVGNVDVNPFVYTLNVGYRF